MSTYLDLIHSASISHHGVKGQKWGVRRFQNPDGSLTPAGKERYGSLFKTRNGPKETVETSEDLRKKIETVKTYIRDSGFIREDERRFLDNLKREIAENPDFVRRHKEVDEEYERQLREWCREDGIDEEEWSTTAVCWAPESADDLWEDEQEYEWQKMTEEVKRRRENGEYTKEESLSLVLNDAILRSIKTYRMDEITLEYGEDMWDKPYDERTKEELDAIHSWTEENHEYYKIADQIRDARKFRELPKLKDVDDILLKMDSKIAANFMFLCDSTGYKDYIKLSKKIEKNNVKSDADPYDLFKEWLND